MARKNTGLTKDEFVSEAQRLVTDLAFYAGRPVKIKLVGGDHIAFTYNTEDTKHVIEVVLNPNCVKDVRTKERATLILRGIGYHELLHHLHPAEEQYKQANEEGFMPLFNLIDDEQNERRGASQFPEWGAHFQSVCAFIFPTARRRASKISTGIADGGADENEEANNSGFGAHAVYRERWSEFAYHLRRHIPHHHASAPQTHPVAQALELIPANFKDLPKESLLQLTRAVHQLLATGLDIPAPVKKEDRPAPPPPSGASGASAGATSDDAPDPSIPWWKRLLNSKWSWAALATALVLWAALFSKGGSDAWFAIAMWCLGVGGFVLAYMVLRALWLRLRQKAQLKKAAFTLAEDRGPGFFKRLWSNSKSTLGSILGVCFGWLPRLFERIVPPRLMLNIKLKIKFAFKWTWRGITLTWHRLERVGAAIARAARWVWNRKVTRITLIAFPLACLLMMLWAVLTKAGEINWWLAILVLLLLLLLLFLGWYFRAKLKDFLVGDVLMDSDFEHAADIRPPMDFETLDFNLIEDILPVEADDDFLTRALPVVQPLAQSLRPVLARVGRVPKEKDDEPVGHDVIDELEALYLGETNVFVDEEEVNAASLHIEVAVDCSSSMNSENKTLKRGEKFELAKLFALAVEEATKNQRGISTRFWGFTDTVIYDCGTAGEYKITGLRAMGGNNDSAMLYHMGKSAQNSGKAVKMLFMLSDGQPSDCSWGSLRNLVVRMEADGMVPWHFALDQIDNSAFEKYFTDLCGQPLPEAIMTMCGILAAIANQK